MVMNSQVKGALIGVAIAAMLLLIGCVENIVAHVEREGAQATAERPVSTEVAVVRIPTDPNLPTYVIVVEPFVMGASGVTPAQGYQGMPSAGAPVILNPGDQIGPGVSAQLLSTLSHAGNFKLIDWDTYQRDPDKVTKGVRPDERGPFLIRGAITEFSETADTSVKGESTGPNIPSMFIPIVGGLVSYGIGTKAETEAKHVGMVGLDIQIVDPVTGRLITSFTAEGSFTSVSVTKSRTQWGGTRSNTESASSAIGQAQRIALNKAVTQIHELVQ